jgi:hypothetical protein
MVFNRRKMEDQRRDAAEKEAANRRATDAQVLEGIERCSVVDRPPIIVKAIVHVERLD